MITLHKAAAGALTALLVPLGLIGPASAASAAPAQTAPTVQSAQNEPRCDVRPRGVTVGAKAQVRTFDVPSARTWSFELPGLALPLSDTSPEATFTMKGLTNADAAWYTFPVARTRADGTADTCIGSFALKRATRVQHIKVTKIKYGRKITGDLQQIVWGKKPAARWTSFSKQPIDIEFKNTAGHWVTGGRVETKKGKFVFTKQIGKRDWRLWYQGDGEHGSAGYYEFTG